jgi:hypothetical protein
MIDRLEGLGPREYPQSWWLIDVLDRQPRLLSQEVVDLSPGAIELRHVAADLRRFAEVRERWRPLGSASPIAALGSGHRRDLSFGPALTYCVEHDDRLTVHSGKPFRHLSVRMRGSILTPATSAEIGLYFYGRRPAAFGFVGPGRVHGFIGMEWEPVGIEDVKLLLKREASVE